MSCSTPSAKSPGLRDETKESPQSDDGAQTQAANAWERMSGKWKTVAPTRQTAVGTYPPTHPTPGVQPPEVSRK